MKKNHWLDFPSLLETERTYLAIIHDLFHSIRDGLDDRDRSGSPHFPCNRGRYLDAREDGSLARTQKPET